MLEQELKESIDLTASMSYIFHPFKLTNFTDSLNVLSYFGFKNGLFSLYPANNYEIFVDNETEYKCPDGRVINYYDPRCRDWFNL